MVPLAAGAVRGTDAQEAVIRALLISDALCLIGAVGLLVWGLRGWTHPESTSQMWLEYEEA